MKFLGIRNSHDCNISYSDGNKVKYIKFERLFQKKHYHWNEFAPKVEDVPLLLEKAKEVLGVDFRDLDGIAIVADITHHNIDGKYREEIVVGDAIPPDQTFAKVDTKIVSFWEQFNCPVYNLDHHFSHTLSCWPLVDVTKVKNEFVLDGLGDHNRHTSFFKNKKLIESVNRYQNLGLSINIEQVGQALGIRGMVLDVAGKLMALKAWHTLPLYIEEKIFDICSNMNYNQLNEFLQICFNVQNTELPQATDKEKLMNVAHLLHVWGERKLPEYMANYVDDVNETITYSGGTAQNTIVNTKLKEKFPNIVIPPHCPDDGLSLGCIEFLRQKFDQPLFDNSNFPFWQSDIAPSETPTKQTIEKTAELLAQGKIVGWYQGNGEIGPRALGNRSILMDPSIKDGKAIINSKVKRREPYRPFGASVLLEETEKLFDCDYESPYMLYVVKCKQKEEFPAIVHVDDTCRIQTVNQDPQNAFYYDLIETFRKKTGIPMVLNTSLNIDGKPIAADPSDAHKLYDISDMDAVVIGNDIRVK